jgi:UDP-N-acetylmuramoyl-L-alanyl-D-glutamate--2,6-diaminopimelate ligase
MASQVLEQLRRQHVPVERLCGDSRVVRPGDVFVAYPGAHVDGRRFIGDAVRRGAAAVLWERTDFVWDESLTVPNIGVDELQALSGHVAHLVYGQPSEKLQLIGVTGTNGKTSVSQWLALAFDCLERRCAVIGTIGSGFIGELQDSVNTTPDAITLHGMLAAFLSRGAVATAMEVSSIGLDQGRVNGAQFDIAVFTNLTRDHLEYHGTMAAYAAAKAKLLTFPGLRSVVLNLDDDFGHEQAARLAGAGVQRMGYSLDGTKVPPGAVDALLHAEKIVVTGCGLRFEVVAPAGRASVEVPLIGRFNVSNLLAVLGTLIASGVPLSQAIAVLPHLAPPPGRMQMLGGDQAPLVVVDYAHTPDALEQALVALRESARARSGRLICVFGCGGDRDPGKRPLMGAVAARVADRVMLTSDNPRGELPAAIIADIAAGAGAAALIEEDRAEAIRSTVAAAQAEDVVLIAGKGHESYQEVAGVRLPFSDVEHAKRALAARGGSRP